MPSSPKGPCSTGNTTSTAPSALRHARRGAWTSIEPGAPRRCRRSQPGRDAVDRGQRSSAEIAQPRRCRPTRAPSGRRWRCRSGPRRRRRGRSPPARCRRSRRRSRARWSAHRRGRTDCVRRPREPWLRAGGGEVAHGDRTLPAYPGAMAAPSSRQTPSRPRRATTARRPLRPATLAVTAGRPPHEPDQPLNTPVTLASTYVAGGDVEYGRYGNPTWTAFEEALGALEGGRCLPFSSGLAAAATSSTSSVQDATVVVPRHCLQRHGDAAGRPGGARPAQRAAGRRHRPRRPADRLRGRRAGLAGVPHQPGPGGDRPRPGDRGRPRGRRIRRGGQHLRHPAAAAAARAWTPTWWCTRRPSSSPATATCSWERSSRGRHELYDVLKKRRDLVGNAPGPFEAWLALRGLRTLSVRLDRAQANARELVERLAVHPGGRGGPLPGLRCHHRRGARRGWDGSRPGHPLDRDVGAMPPASAGSSRPSSGAAGGRSSRPPSPTAWCGMSVGIEDVEDLWDDLSHALDAPVAGRST